jgi:TonB family protein
MGKVAPQASNYDADFTGSNPAGAAKIVRPRGLGDFRRVPLPPMKNLAKIFAVVCLSTMLSWAQTNETKPATQPNADVPTATPIPDSTKLNILKSVKAIYPMQAAQKQVQGEVMLKVLVNEQGDVEHAEVVSGDPVLVPAALDAIRKWKFEPFYKNGRPIKVATKIPFDFAFSGNVSDTPEKDALTLKSPSGEDNPKRVRVSQIVSQGLLVHKVNPVYPPEARHARVQGTVVMRAVIGSDGRLKELHTLTGDATLAKAATDAVQQWRYRPYVLNGEPVEVETQITVNFTLAGG